jgi:hypothetical protein
MTSMKFSSLGGFAAHLLTIEADLHLTEEVCVEKACRMIEKEAKAAIGTYRFDWTPLQLETIARKAGGDTPLLETGELKDSIEHTVGREGRDVVGKISRARDKNHSVEVFSWRGGDAERTQDSRNDGADDCGDARSRRPALSRAA